MLNLNIPTPWAFLRKSVFEQNLHIKRHPLLVRVELDLVHRFNQLVCSGDQDGCCLVSVHAVSRKLSVYDPSSLDDKVMGICHCAGIIGRLKFQPNIEDAFETLRMCIGIGDLSE